LNLGLVENDVNVGFWSEFFDRTGADPYHCAPMLNRQLPHQINLRKFVDRGVILEGVVDISRFKQFAQGLSSEAGQAAVKLRFFQGARGKKLIEGSVDVVVQQDCQRCLLPLQSRLEIELNLVLITDSEADPQAVCLPREPLPGQVQNPETVVYEPLVLDNEEVDLVDIIEDDLVLALPMIPYHDLETCEALGYVDTFGDDEHEALHEPRRSVAKHSDKHSEEGDRENPFAVLKALKNKV